MSLIFNPYNGPWLQIYQQLVLATPIDATNYNPIPKFLLPIQISNRVFVAGASSQKAKVTWRFAGRIVPLIDCGSADFGQAELSGYGVPLNKGNLFILPSYASAYKLRFEPFFWMEDILLSVWEFAGDLSDSTEDLIRAVSST